MRYLLLLPLLVSAWLCHAQNVVNTTGFTLSGASLTVEYSIGEVASFTLSSNQRAVTQGLLQPIGFAPPGWDPLPCYTGIVHTVALLGTTITSISGQSLSLGDLVGFFYMDGTNTVVCSNFGVWQGNSLSLDLCGDSPATPNIKEGYAPGENFQIRVWKNNIEYNVIGCYVPEDTYALNEPSATGSFASFGLSYIDCLKTPAEPGSNLGCDAPITIACGETKTGNNANGILSANAYNCFDNLVDGPEVVYQFNNPVAQNVLITLTGLQSDLELLLLQPCDQNGCILYSDRTGPSPEAITAENLPAGSYFIVVEGYLGASSNYQLEVRCGNGIPVNGALDCSAAAPLACGQTLNSNTNNGSDVIIQYNCSSGYESGKEKIYTISTPDINKIISITLDDMTADLDLFVLDQCDLSTCFVSSTTEGTTGENVFFYATPGKTYYVVVDGYFDQQSPYSLQAACYDYDPNYVPCDTCPVPDYEIDCASAQPISCGVPVTGNTKEGVYGADYYSCSGPANGKELVYTFENTTVQDLTIILSGLSTDLNLFLLNDCSIFNCIAVGNKTGASDEGVVKQALPPGKYYIVVDGFDAAADGSFSLLINCTNASLICQNIALVAGTNFVSSNILPIDPAIEAILPPSAQSLIISIENQNNQSYSPSAQTNPNDFDDWDFRAGYRIKALQATSFSVCGSVKAEPGTPIPYVANTVQGLPLNNWIAYLKDNPTPVGDKFTLAATPDVFRVWNMPTGPTGTLTPQSYLVTLQTGTNFEMQTGRGYILNASADGIFSYGSYSGGQAEERGGKQTPIMVENGCQYFATPYQSTLHTATVLVPEAVLQARLSIGDEIGLFNQNGTLCGSGRFNSYGLAMVATGDEPNTVDNLEGFLDGEPISFRLWKMAENQVYDLKATIRKGSAHFIDESVLTLDDLEILQASAVRAPEASLIWSAYPNPAADILYFDLLLPDASPAQLQLLTPDGKLAQEISVAPLATGITRLRANVRPLSAGFYWARLITTQGISTKKIILVK